MKTFAFALLSVLAYAARDADGNALPDPNRRDCVCCRRLSDADHELRMLCLPPSDEDQRAIDYYCNDEEQLDRCIERLEADETANAVALADLKEIYEDHIGRVAEHDEEHEHDHEHDHDHEDMSESGAFQGLSAVTALATAIVLASF